MPRHLHSAVNPRKAEAWVKFMGCSASEPPFGFPLRGIRAPDGLKAVGAGYSDEKGSASRDGHGRDGPRGRCDKRNCAFCERSVLLSVHPGVGNILTYVRRTNGTGAYLAPWLVPQQLMDLGTNKRSVSLRTASSHGSVDISSRFRCSRGLSAACAARISCRTLCWISGWVASRCNIRESAEEEVSWAPNIITLLNVS